MQQVEIETRELGRSGLKVPRLCLGGNVFGWTLDEQRSFAVLDRAFEAGLRFIDTADVYSRWVPGNQGGESETILGKWMKARGNRDRIVVATKVGMDMGEGRSGLGARRIQEAVDGSLQRLQTDRIDLYQAHKDDPSTPLEETLTAFGDLVRAGKVRAIGASNYSGQRLAEAMDISRRHGLPRYESLQPNYNLYAREEFETGMEPVCRENNIGVIGYYSLASGFLTGKYRSEKDLGQSARGHSVSRYLNERGFRILAALDSVAGKHQAKQAEVALAWLIARPSVTAPIASATSAEQVDSLLAATELRLDAEDLERLNEASMY